MKLLTTSNTDFWLGFEKRAVSLPAYNLRNAMIAGVPLGAAMGGAAKAYTNRHPEAQARADKALLSQKRTGIHPALMGAMVGPFVMAGSYGLTNAGEVIESAIKAVGRKK